jgi:hypothetical protein
MDPVVITALIGGGGGVIGTKALDLLTQVLSPVADELGHDLRDRLAARRARNLEAVAKQAAEKVTEPIDSESTSLATRVRLIEEASLADDDSGLQKYWAGLLASAVSGHSVLASYPGILSDLTAPDARLLDALGHAIEREHDEETTTVAALGNSAGLDGDQVFESADNLLRLRLCVIKVPRAGEVVKEIHLRLQAESTLQLTTLGRNFLRACNGPRKDSV